MAVKEIITEPNEILRKVSKPLKKLVKNEKQLIDDMFETMYFKRNRFSCNSNRYSKKNCC